MPLAVIVPARNAASTLPDCLTAIRASGSAGLELIVIDDGSTDDTSRVADRHGARVLRQDTSTGPARARNLGVGATDADIVLFVDADVVIRQDAIPRVIAAFEHDPELAAVFGSYDDSPGAHTFVSDYKNLLHHFTHQTAQEDSQSFWAGCGAVRREVFLSLGGFDERYRRASIEDIEFGGRCARAHHRIRLDKALQGKHLKRWTLPELLRVDIRDRAYPWSRLIVESGTVHNDLNLQLAQRASAALVWAAALCALTAVAAPARWQPALLLGTGLCLATVVWLNRAFYRWLLHHRGSWFALGSLCLHVFYYAYSSLTFGWVWLRSLAPGSSSA